MDIKLNFINNTSDASNSKCVIFQKNIATEFDELAVAWKVIENCGRGNSHLFTLPMAMTIYARDKYENTTSVLPAQYGQMFTYKLDSSGPIIALAGTGSKPDEVQLRNDLPEGATKVCILKNGKRLATEKDIAPGEIATFAFKPTIWIGAVAQMEEGQMIDPRIVSEIDTEISLLGIASADIVATGGGSGKCSTISFNLENVKWRDDLK